MPCNTVPNTQCDINTSIYVYRNGNSHFYHSVLVLWHCLIPSAPAPSSAAAVVAVARLFQFITCILSLFLIIIMMIARTVHLNAAVRQQTVEGFFWLFQLRSRQSFLAALFFWNFAAVVCETHNAHLSPTICVYWTMNTIRHEHRVHGVAFVRDWNTVHREHTKKKKIARNGIHFVRSFNLWNSMPYNRQHVRGEPVPE